MLLLHQLIVCEVLQGMHLIRYTVHMQRLVSTVSVIGRSDVLSLVLLVSIVLLVTSPVAALIWFHAQAHSRLNLEILDLLVPNVKFVT